MLYVFRGQQLLVEQWQPCHGRWVHLTDACSSPGPRGQTVERLRAEPCCRLLGDVLQRGCCHSCGARPAASDIRRRLAQHRLQYSG